MNERIFSLVCVIYGVNEHKKGHKKGKFEPAGLGKLFAKHFYFICVVGDCKAIARSFVDPVLDMGSFLNVIDPASWGAI
jgi:hypothetical protein